MNIYYPLADHPEFSVLEYPGYREYKLENNKSANSSTLQIWLSTLLVPALIAFLWQNAPPKLCAGISFIYIVYSVKYKVLGSLHESVIILPPHGIQLETHSGFSKNWSLLITRRFISSTTLVDVVINEGLSGWNVLYYLAAVKSDPLRGSSLEVAYENLRPCHSILLQVYQGVHEILLSRSTGYNIQNTDDTLNN